MNFKQEQALKVILDFIEENENEIDVVTSDEGDVVLVIFAEKGLEFLDKLGEDIDINLQYVKTDGDNQSFLIDMCCVLGDIDSYLLGVFRDIEKKLIEKAEKTIYVPIKEVD